MQQITKKFLSSHFTHDFIRFTHDIIITEKNLSYQSAGMVQMLTADSKSQSTRQRGEILEVFNTMSDKVSWDLKR